MFPKGRLLHEQLNAFNRIAVEEIRTIVITKVGWIDRTILTNFEQLQGVDGHPARNFVQPFDYSL